MIKNNCKVLLPNSLRVKVLEYATAAHSISMFMSNDVEHNCSTIVLEGNSINVIVIF